MGDPVVARGLEILEIFAEGQQYCTDRVSWDPRLGGTLILDQNQREDPVARKWRRRREHQQIREARARQPEQRIPPLPCTHECSICGAQFASAQAVIAHAAKIHAARQYGTDSVLDPSQLEDSGARKRRRRRLREDQQIREARARQPEQRIPPLPCTHECSICGAQFGSDRAAQIHAARVHRP